MESTALLTTGSYSLQKPNFPSEKSNLKGVPSSLKLRDQSQGLSASAHCWLPESAAELWEQPPSSPVTSWGGDNDTLRWGQRARVLPWAWDTGQPRGRQQLLQWLQMPRQQHPTSTYLRISSISGTCKDFQRCQGAHGGRSLDRGHVRRWHKLLKQILALLVKPSIHPEQFLQWKQSVRKRDTQNQPDQRTARGRDGLEDEAEGHTLRSSSCGSLTPAPPAAPALQRLRSWAGRTAQEKCFQQRTASLHGQNHFSLLFKREKNSVLATCEASSDGFAWLAQAGLGRNIPGFPFLCPGFIACKHTWSLLSKVSNLLIETFPHGKRMSWTVDRAAGSSAHRGG